MTIEGFVIIASLVLLTICGIGYWCASNTVYIRRKIHVWSLQIYAVLRLLGWEVYG